MLRLTDRWLWDFWFADDGPDRHVFFLQAPRSLGDPDLRHVNASVGHAVSTDLRTWRVLPDALAAGTPGEWDDRAIWTGSVVRAGGTWWMFYTGTNRGELGAVQRIGAATSTDLSTWHRHPANPLIEASPPWYQATPGAPFRDVAWRDPWVVVTGSVARCYITATAADGPLDGRGVIALATSSDMVRWRVDGPAYAPGEFAEMEVPQVVTVGARTAVLFSVPAGSHRARWQERTGMPPRTATYYVSAPSARGPFSDHPRPIDVGQRPNELYAGKLVDAPTGSPSFIAARFDGPDGEFAGELIDPIPLVQHPDGRIARS